MQSFQSLLGARWKVALLFPVEAVLKIYRYLSVAIAQARDRNNKNKESVKLF
jgi:hypothetical protein